MKKVNYLARFLAIALLLLLATVFLTGGYYNRVMEFLGYKLINFNGSMNKLLQIQGYNSDIGLYATDDNYYVYIAAKTSTDYEVEQTVAFRDFLKDNGINFLYVNEPTKYVDDHQFRNSFGVESYSNSNIDLFLKRIRNAGVNTIDLRDNISQEGLNINELFYRTDHHWTTATGLWASRIMADGLNRYCGYNIDLSIYASDKYTYRSWNSCWVGEQGKKAGITCAGLDDYTEIKPAFKTDYSFINKDGTTYNGDFSNFINESTYTTCGNYYLDPSWHYSYRLINCINNNAKTGKILLIGDSYDHVTECFLSLGVRETDVIILRDTPEDFSIRDQIIKNGYDTVIIAYAQHMVGARDDPHDANYRMFSLDK